MTPSPADEPTDDFYHGLEPRSVRSLYDRWARVYDLNPVLDLVRPARRRAVAAMGLSRGDTVVDMGTGTGANLPLLREAVGSTGTVVGIDLSPGMLDRARERVRRHGWTNVELVEGDVRDPPLDGPVDGIVSAFVVVMYPDADRLVDTWSAYVEDGVMANLYAGPSHRWYAPVTNGLLELYLRLFEEGWDAAESGTRAIDVLAARGERARSALEQSAGSVSHHGLVFGLAQLDIGRYGTGPAGDRSR